MGSKLKRPSGGGSAISGGQHGAVRVPVPLAALCCLAFFLAGSFFGGNHSLNLPDTKQPQKVGGEAGERTTQGQQQQQQQHRLQEEQLQQVGSSQQTAGTQVARRQLAAQTGTGVTLTKAPSLPQPYPHGSTGDGYFEEISFQMLSWRPRAYVFFNFAPPEKCRAIVEAAQKKLSPSGLALRSGETLDATRDIRTSSGAFLSSRMDPTGSLAWVENKMAKVAMIPPNYGEAYNVLRYEVGQKYDSHMDVFDPKEYGPQPSNRVASFLLYLTDVEEGGETMFPYEGGNNMDKPYNFKDCIGLKVKPRMGDALLFWSMLPDGKIDPTALHGSCPVVKGKKWVATKWIRDKPMFSAF